MAARPFCKIESTREPLGHPPGAIDLVKKTMIMRGGARGALARACEAQRAHGRLSMHMREGSGSAVSRLIASRTLTACQIRTLTLGCSDLIDFTCSHAPHQIMTE